MAEAKSDVLQGTLDLMVLKTIEGMGPLHGYGIARRIEQVSDNGLSLNQGTIYPALLRLQQQPARVLAFLLSNRGSLVTREQIRLAIWGDDTFVDFEQGLNFCIRQLRAALGDDDGVLFISEGQAVDVLEAAHHIWQVEREQANKIRAGETLRRQVAFADYLDRRVNDGRYTFRQHLRRVGGSIEE